ncbi:MULTISPECIES: hypothetical protein [unclassified Cupriavidus]|uniref:hypothetical protein n=1 Tax=Cupriavidus sp. 2SB TaxID=2502199 RepID=UPI00192422CF|nr:MULTISPECIES: hypothetical protein [unclassified Cupriavidus]
MADNFQRIRVTFAVALQFGNPWTTLFAAAILFVVLLQQTPLQPQSSATIRPASDAASGLIHCGTETVVNCLDCIVM